ncbi:MAG: outer membrane protein assembly factor BamA, partial [Bacteroidaceae bacterium]|nr:outer membrane protein assembly factor BamA [Bacteroidaceae bacterium]
MKYIKYITLLAVGLFALPNATKAQDVEKIEKPVILYSATPRTYEIGGIAVEGVKNYDDYVIIGISGLSVGQQVTLPGDDITKAVKRYWKHGLFSRVKIDADSIIGNKIYLSIHLVQRPRVAGININGVKKSEREDLLGKLGLIKGNQITPNMIDRSKTIIKRYYDEKGFKNAEATIVQRDDVSDDSQVFVDIDIDKKAKIKVNSINITGASVLSANKIKKAMKKTNEKGKLKNFFKTKKFITEKYDEDKKNIITKYNELGYRDAIILSDSVVQHDENSVDIYLNIEEGNKYYLRNVEWVGNTVYPTSYLNQKLHMKRGDVYNQKLLNDRLTGDEDAIGNDYYNHGYVFYQLNPVEVNIDNDSIDLEMRITEGSQAHINHVRISGNDR